MRKTLLNLFAITTLVAATTGASAQVVFIALEPANVAGNYDFTYTDGWAMDLTANSVQDTVVVIHDGTAGDTLGCNPTTNNVAGKIALIYRGTCEFGAKALAAQTAGAVGVIIVNNVSGAPIAMGAGAVGATVTIPAVMISQADGATLRGAVDAGTTVVFMGTIAGLYANNLSIYQRDIATANGFAIPRQLALATAGFEVPLQAWVRNYGTAEQTNVQLRGTVGFEGAELYNEISATGLTIPAGDSALVVLPAFSMATPANGSYIINYAVLADATDEYAVDNTAEASFWVNDDKFSRCRLDPATGESLSNNGLRPSTGTEFEWCVAFHSGNAEAMAATGITFSVTSTTTATDTAFLTGLGFQLKFFEWNDDISTAVTFDALNQIGSAFYDFTAHTPDLLVTANFDEGPLALQNDQKYLGCLHVFDDSVYVNTDGGIDYNTNYDAYPGDAFYPIFTDTWYAGGFGSDYTPILIINMDDLTGVNEVAEQVKLTPYPNPTLQMINVPLNKVYTGSLALTAHDASGRLVLSKDVNMNGTDVLRIDGTTLATGLNVFNLRFSDGTTSTFRVMLTR